MKYFIDFMNQYGVTFIHSIAALVLSYVSFEIKRIYNKCVNEKTKKEVVKMVCNAINQLYPNISGEEKLNKAISNSKEILLEKNINISDLELRMYIECYVGCFKNMGVDIDGG